MPTKSLLDRKAAGSTIKKMKATLSRERVLKTAAQVFAEKGYAGTTMRVVAERAGLQAGSLYYHYRSKEELIEAVLSMGLRGVADSVRLAVAAVPETASARELIDTAIIAHLTSLLEYGDYALASRRLLGQVPPRIRRKHIDLRDEYGDFWLALLETALGSGELRPGVDLHLARAFTLGALNYALEWYRPGGKPLEEIGSEFSLMICDGIFSRRLSE
ncbi:MAG: TetR/AcrR family transcriptional regulator [Sphingomonadaceae bacterium]|jgi:AcrR family transcriptional regulator|nr:TetR/AcrR family transcriptional regulator [Sphingomonadaceae bacterium]